MVRRGGTAGIRQRWRMITSCPSAGSADRKRQDTLQASLLALPSRSAFPPAKGSGAFETGIERGSQRRDRSGFAPDSLFWPAATWRTSWPN